MKLQRDVAYAVTLTTGEEIMAQVDRVADGEVWARVLDEDGQSTGHHVAFALASVASAEPIGEDA